MARVLKPGGRLIGLDITHPPDTPWGKVLRLGFEQGVTRVAGLLSGDRSAYRYLPNSLSGYPTADELSAMLGIGGAGRCDVPKRLSMGGGGAARRLGSASGWASSAIIARPLPLTRRPPQVVGGAAAASSHSERRDSKAYGFQRDLQRLSHRARFGLLEAVGCGFGIEDDAQPGSWRARVLRMSAICCSPARIMRRRAAQGK